MNFELFRDNLRQLRVVKGITAFDLSAKAGLRQKKRINDIEEGRGSPDIDEVAAICQSLEASIDDMLFKKIKVHITFN